MLDPRNSHNSVLVALQAVPDAQLAAFIAANAVVEDADYANAGIDGFYLELGRLSASPMSAERMEFGGLFVDPMERLLHAGRPGRDGQGALE